MMKAAVLRAPNTPLEIEERPEPEPGPGQVRLRMRASGLCGTDMHVYRGHFPVPMPVVFGHEPVGVVDKVGAGVTAFSSGDRVGVSWVQSGCGQCAQCVRHKEVYCPSARSWVENGGANAELMVADAWGVTRLPDAISWEEAAPVFCAGYTVMSGYRNAQPRPGERVAVIGVGGLGHLALQVAKAMGHETVAVTSSEDKREEARRMGADEVLVVRSHAGEELRALGGADVVLSTSNSMKQNSDVLLGLRPEGRFVAMAIGGEPIAVQPTPLLLSQVRVIGSTQDEREDLVEILELVASRKVRPVLEVYRFAEINKAIDRLRDGKVRYRAVVAHEG